MHTTPTTHRPVSGPWPKHRARWLGAAMLTTLLSSCSQPPERSTSDSPVPQPSQPQWITPPESSSREPGTSTTSPTTETPNESSVIDVTTKWFVAYHSMRWTDTGPAAWIDRVRPYVSARQHDRDETLRNGARGAEWTEFVAGRCATSMTDVEAVIPPEAPRTASVVYVHVIGSSHTACTTADPVLAPSVEAATLMLIKTPSGWRVDERLY